jgi:PAS domain S-box-containing protein
MRSDERDSLKKYEAPAVKRVTLTGAPERMRTELVHLLAKTTREKEAFGKSNDGCRMLLSLQGRFKHISEEFCRLIGYEQKELIGKCIDDITAARTVSVSQHLSAVLHFGQFHSLWMFVAREGRGIMVRCEWELLPDMSMSIFCEPVSAGTAFTTDVLGKKLR